MFFPDLSIVLMLSLVIVLLVMRMRTVVVVPSGGGHPTQRDPPLKFAMRELSLTTLRTGKHRGKSFGHVCREFPDYVRWCAERPASTGDQLKALVEFSEWTSKVERRTGETPPSPTGAGRACVRRRRLYARGGCEL